MSTEFSVSRIGFEGAVGGAAGGMAMGMVSMMGFPLLGAGGFWSPLTLIASAVMPDAASAAGFAAVPVLVGTMLHMATSMGLGMALALGANATGKHWYIAALSGAMLAGGAVHFVLPSVAPAMGAAFPLALFAMGHAVFGLVVAAWLDRRVPCACGVAPGPTARAGS